MSKYLENQIALVTGAGRGIGYAIALRLGKEGAFVIGTDISESGLNKLEHCFEKEGIQGRSLVLDVADPVSIETLDDELRAADQIPQILVNNAGITRDNLLVRMKEEEWASVINTNLNSVFYLSKTFLRDMMKARYGRIVNIASVVALSGNPGQVNYSASKAGMIGFTRSLAREVGSRGITVNAVAPGFIDTDMTKLLSDEQRAALLRQTALNRLGEVDEIAAVVSFLVSPGAAYITGETINVNGGMYMG
ncbi:MAG: 3-oxoacyl-[acyl-carrier-protein] reductase [Gammaproteobacteria bacterium RBG_16_51_14]|nr:MAG: 3-oxoacyl-[acyl-carrier-protein] reductase [Gammaproteobacteria bacterium RBG_16_51_14]